MTYSEVYGLIEGAENKESNVVITSRLSNRQYKQNLYISSADRLKIRGYGTSIAGYNVTDEMTDHWESIRLVKKRKVKKVDDKVEK